MSDVVIQVQEQEGHDRTHHLLAAPLAVLGEAGTTTGAATGLTALGLPRKAAIVTSRAGRGTAAPSAAPRLPT